MEYQWPLYEFTAVQSDKCQTIWQQIYVELWKPNYIFFIVGLITSHNILIFYLWELYLWEYDWRYGECTFSISVNGFEYLCQQSMLYVIIKHSITHSQESLLSTWSIVTEIYKL